MERPAAAFTYGSAISKGCHERITTATLRTIRSQLMTAPAIAPSGEEVAFIADLPFGVEDDLRELAGATLLVGVRDNDLKGNTPTEIDTLATVHGNPNNQEEHCLRAMDDDEPDGAARALDKCRAFIRTKVTGALDGLDANSVPDPTKRTDLRVALELRGKVDASLPLFWVFMGQALHTIQDSFAHTFRTADRLRVGTVMNYIEYVDGNEVESRDGPLHRTGLDKCEGLDDLQTLNIAVATQASIDLLHATLDPSLDRAGKLAAVEVVLAKYLTLEPGCTNDNGWCDAPERQYQVSASCGCSTVGHGRSGILAAGACVLGVALLGWRRRRRQLGKTFVGLSLLVACLALPTAAQAQETTTAPAGPVTTDPSTGATVAADPTKPPPGVPTQTQVANEQKEKEHQGLFGVYGAVSGAITNPALNGQLGVRLRLSKLFSVGVDGELNGVYGIQTSKFRTGFFNAYATGIIHYPIRFASVNLRTTGNIGTSTMLIDLYGAPKGTTGIYLGLVPLGLEVKLASKLYLVFDALGVALPIPQLKGAPYSYPQYRTSVGLELTF